MRWHLRDNVFNAKTERFVFVLPIHLHKYNENRLKNGDFWKRRLKWRLQKQSREKYLCKQQKGIVYLVNMEAIGSWLSHDWTGCARKSECKIEQGKLLSLSSVTVSAIAKASSSSVLWLTFSCAHNYVIVRPACNDFIFIILIMCTFFSEYVCVNGTSSLCKWI